MLGRVLHLWCNSVRGAVLSCVGHAQCNGGCCAAIGSVLQQLYERHSRVVGGVLWEVERYCL